MARRTYTDVDGYVLTRIGNRSEATTALREQWINDALLRVTGKFVHPEMEGIALETIVSTTDYIIPTATDIFTPLMVKDVTNGKILDPASKEEIEHILTKPSGAPARFYWWGRVFYFDRIPSVDTNCRIWYRKKPARWSAGEAALDEAYDFVIEQYAAENALNFFREYEKAQFAKSQVEQYIRDMQLPLQQQKHNDYAAGVKVRMR